MRTVYIIRHAKSSWEDPDLPDIMRPLNGRGRKASVLVGHHLSKMGESPTLIISSPATRAYHTAINIANGIGYRTKDIMLQPSIYFEGDNGVLNALIDLGGDHQSIFIVGHEPTCSDVIYRLCGEMIGKFATGSVFRIELDIDNWADISNAKGKKIYFISPKELKD